MSTISDLWASSPDQLRDKHVWQVMGFCGAGKLRDGDASADEFREFLGQIPSEILSRYGDECLRHSFPDSGMVLQDVVNEIGRRLGFQVAEGRYRGVPGQVGLDGLWRFKDGRAVMVEVKTTDVYNIDLGRVAQYRRELIEQKVISEAGSSVLIVVGRGNTGNTEAQIRGSRHAWDMRLISVDALVRLMAVKEGAEDPNIHRQIQEVLVPREFTRIDEIIELVFRAAEDVRKEEEIPEEEEERGTDSPVISSSEAVAPRGRVEKKFTPVAFHAACADRVQEKLGRPLLKRSRATYSSTNDDLRLVCSVSREYVKEAESGYWFAFHPHQKEFLEAVTESFVAYGCGSPAKVLFIPFRDFEKWVDQLNTTELEDRYYWHVHIRERNGRFELHRKEGGSRLDLTGYLI